MAEVLLFHHAQGQTAGFHAFADELRRAGHTVHTPDLFDGRTFGSIDEGVAYAGRGRLRRDHRARGARRGRAAERARLRRLLARRGTGAEAGADPPGRARGAALLLLRAHVRVRDVVAGGRAGADPRDGRGPDLRRRGRHRRRPRARRVDRGCRAVPLPRRPALLRRQQPAELRRGRHDAAHASACSRSSTSVADAPVPAGARGRALLGGRRPGAADARR